jgi:hypothetical protein
MLMSTWNRRVLISGCGAVLGAAMFTPIASAQTAPTAPTPVAPITLSPQESQRLCDTVLPRLEQRAEKLTNTVNGGPDVRGSAQWLKARAQNQRNAGHTRIADQLDQRAQRRAARSSDLAKVRQRLEAFQAQNCKPAGGNQ